MLFGIEGKMESALITLKDSFGMKGVKAEFEAEGSTFEDVVRLRDVTSRCGMGLHIKIGGGEAKRDLIDSVVLGADGVIAPMIESEFAAHKFMLLAKSIYSPSGRFPEMAINVETRQSVENIDAIITRCKGFLNQITIGRSDLCASFFDASATPDSEAVMALVEKAATKAKQAGLRVAMGGSISVRTISKLIEMPHLMKKIDLIETRKCILDAKSMLEIDALKHCFEFEKLYLLSLNERLGVFNAANTQRLIKLGEREI